MNINGWHTLKKTLLMLENNNNGVSGPVVYLHINNKMVSSGVHVFSCTHKVENNQWTYDIRDQSQRAPLGFSAPVYWLPWEDGRSRQIQISSLNRSGADIFITSRMSGCHFIGCEASVSHVAPNSSQNNNVPPVSHAFNQMFEILEDVGVALNKINNKFALSPINHGDHTLLGAGKFSYGGGEYPSRACVVGIKHNQEWLFAYQEQTFYTANYAKWYKLN